MQFPFLKAIPFCFILLVGSLSYAQDGVATYQNTSFLELVDFFERYKDSVSASSQLVDRSSYVGSGGHHVWRYLLAKEHYFKATDTSKQTYFDSIQTILLASKFNDTSTLTIYFPPINGSINLHNAIIDIETDLMIQIIKESRPFYFVDSAIKVSDVELFTLCEHVGALEHNDDLTFGNMVFAKKGLIAQGDLSTVIRIINSLWETLKSSSKFKGAGSIVLHCRGERTSYIGLFRIKNGNLTGELSNLESTDNVSALFKREISATKTPGESHVYSNTESASFTKLKAELVKEGISLVDLDAKYIP
jgi:hypothetical protein